MTEDELIIALEKLGWSRPQILRGIRTDFRCEYCHRFLLRSIEDYDSWQVDHIVPISKGGLDEESNMALVCKLCNFMKRNHRIQGHSVAEKKASAMRIVKEKRRSKQIELDAVREVVNEYFISKKEEETQ